MQQTAQHAQLDKFAQMFAPYAAGANFSEALVNGGENPQGEYPSGEANLDIQYAVAMAYDLLVQYIAVGGEYLDFIPDLEYGNLPPPNPLLSSSNWHHHTACQTPLTAA